MKHLTLQRTSRFAMRCLAGLATLACMAPAYSKGIPAKVGFYPGAFLSFPAFVAEEKGFFQSNGLDVTLVPIPNGAAMTAAVASNSIDFANNSYDNLSIAVSKGLPLKAVVGATVRLPLALVVRSGYALPHKKEGYPAIMQDLDKAKVGVIGLGISTHFLTQELFSSAGVSQKNVKYIAVGLPSSARPALKNKSIDAYMSLWPLPAILEAKREGTIAVNLVKGEGPKALRSLEYNGWWATDKTIEDQPEMVKRFVRANEQAYCWYHDPANFDAVVSIMKKYVPVGELNDKQYRQLIRDTLPGYGVTLHKSSIDTWQTLLVRRKLIPHAIAASDLVAATVSDDVACTH